MTVDQPDVIDVLAWRDDPPVVTLVVADHLDWDDVTAHLLALQEKLNRYLAFVEGGELAEGHPDLAGHAILIRVAFLHAPPDAVVEGFLNPAGAVIEAAGFGFDWMVGTVEA